jgi:ATP-dependent Clp protease ATP-binding subunit ClpC
VFERFTEPARRTLVLTLDEARLLGHDDIGTEHILLGLVCEADGVAARALVSLGLSLEGLRSTVEEVAGQGEGALPGQQLSFTASAKKALELSLREAQALGHDYIGTEHLLLGLLDEGEVAGQVLVQAGVEAKVRARVMELLSGRSPEPS